MHEPLLIVEDDRTLRLTVGEFLSRRGYAVTLAETALEARQCLEKTPYALILLDLRLPDSNGLELLQYLRQVDDSCQIIMMTAFPEVRTAVAALKAGAYDYINKPFDLDELLELLSRAVETRRLRHELAWRRMQGSGCVPLIGQSPTFRQMQAIVQRIAQAAQIPVLIRGESGTGKEHVAQAVHCQSARAEGPWIAVNCAALPENLLEAEMFGYEKGAFTDARQAKPGLLELANGGTLFLDEIGDLSLSLQPKLLRVLESQCFRRLGGQRERQVDVRFVAATHRDLRAMIDVGQFREDLYYRLNVGVVDVPPLRERREDILPLAQHFLHTIRPTLGLSQLSLLPEVACLLQEYAWPGNIRELRNVMERAAILTNDGEVKIAHLPAEMRHAQKCTDNSAPNPSSLRLADVEHAHIQRVLSACAGNKTHAAELLGITRATLRTKLQIVKKNP